jgi:hypothetical protein
MSKVSAFVDNALRDEIKRLLATCTEKQNEVFGRAFPGGLDGLSETKLRTALALVQRTVEANARKGVGDASKG